MARLILAHQGGWDEALMVLVPIGVFVAVLVMANRRADRVRSEREAAQRGSHGDDHGGDDHGGDALDGTDR